MRIAFFSAKPYERPFFASANQQHGHELEFLEARLSQETVVLAGGAGAVCAFVNDSADRAVVEALTQQGTRVLALRSAGYNNVDLAAAKELGLTVVRVPAYSPHAVAEHTLGLILALNRGIHRAYVRVRDHNFSLDGLLGFDLHGKTVGIVGTGKIGAVLSQLLSGFGVRLLGYDVQPRPESVAAGLTYVALQQLLAESDIISLHAPLTRENYHLINQHSLAGMKRGAMLVNTSRGGLIDTLAVIHALKDGHLGYLALDVYEEERALFFEDQSNRLLQDDLFARLLTFPNVLITGHQAFFTQEALTQIASATLQNLTDLAATGQCQNTVDS